MTVPRDVIHRDNIPRSKDASSTKAKCRSFFSSRCEVLEIIFRIILNTENNLNIVIVHAGETTLVKEHEASRGYATSVNAQARIDFTGKT